MFNLLPNTTKCRIIQYEKYSLRFNKSTINIRCKSRKHLVFEVARFQIAYYNTYNYTSAIIAKRKEIMALYFAETSVHYKLNRFSNIYEKQSCLLTCLLMSPCQ